MYLTKEKCVICGAETAYDETTNIDLRQNYVEGMGQVCDRCSDRIASNIQIHEPLGNYIHSERNLMMDNACCMMDSRVPCCEDKPVEPGIEGNTEKCIFDDEGIEEKCTFVPFSMIENTPNDSELGWLVRKLYNDNK